jgi:hypothetical protein
MHIVHLYSVIVLSLNVCSRTNIQLNVSQINIPMICKCVEWNSLERVIILTQCSFTKSWATLKIGLIIDARIHDKDENYVRFITERFFTS